MSIARKVATNISAILLLNGLGNAVTLLTLLYLARYLGPALYGEFSFVMTIVSLFTVFTSLGINPIITREISRSKKQQNELINTAIIMRSVLSGFAIFLVNVIAFVLYPNNVLRLAIAIRSTLLFFLSTTSTLTAVFQAKLQMKYPGLVLFLTKLIFPFLTALIILQDRGYVLLIIASTIPFIVEALLLWLIAVKQFLKFKFTVNKHIMIFLLKESWPIAVSGLIYIVYTRTDMFLLSLLSSSESLGFYAAALNITQPIQFITGGIVMTAFPLFARFYKTNIKGFYRTFSLTIKAVIIIAAPLTMVGVVLNHHVIRLVYGEMYLASSMTFAVLSLGAMFLSLNVVFGKMLVAIDKQKIVTIIIAMGAIVNIILDYFLIMRFDFVGAAIATLCVSILTALLSFAVVFKIIKRKLAILTTVKIVAATAISTGIMYFLSENFLFALAVSGVAYIAALFAFKTFTKEEYGIVREIISLNVKAGKW